MSFSGCPWNPVRFIILKIFWERVASASFCRKSPKYYHFMSVFSLASISFVGRQCTIYFSLSSPSHVNFISGIYNNPLFHCFFSRLGRTHRLSHISYRNHSVFLFTFATIFLRLNIQPSTNLLTDSIPSHTERKTNQKGKKYAASLEQLLLSSTQKSRECNSPKHLKCIHLFSSFLEPVTSDK